MMLEDVTQQLEELGREASASLAAAPTLQALEALRVKYLGRPSHSRAPALPSPTRFRGYPGSVARATSP
jgi:hypothetical protein